MRLLSGDQAIASIIARLPGWIYTAFFVVLSHTCTVWSIPPEAIYLPSGDQATVINRALSTCKVASCLPLKAATICTVPSLLARARYWLSGDHASALILREAMV